MIKVRPKNKALNGPKENKEEIEQDLKKKG
jgi:hypothetical protein